MVGLQFAYVDCEEIESSHDVKSLWVLGSAGRQARVLTGIKLKSLILAQIERWRHALHMQVERQHGSLLLVASGERVSKASERALKWGIT